MKFFFLAGEPSGDARAAEVMKALQVQRPEAEFHGLGGPLMHQIGGEEIINWTDRAAVIGIIDVLKNYSFFKSHLDAAAQRVIALQPDAVVLIDYPGFNLRLAKALRDNDATLRIIYYISPQVWAWHRSRIPKMAKMLNLMICIFPFEKPLYEQSGLKTVFVGHPMADTLGTPDPTIPREDTLIGLFPGSRKREVKKIFPVMLETAVLMLQTHPNLRFAASASSEAMGERMHGILENNPNFVCDIRVGNSQDLMRRCNAAMITSGTATLEAAFLRLPYAILYKAAWLTFFLGRKIVKIDFLGMVNILASREIVPEFLQENALPQLIAPTMLRLVDDMDYRNTQLKETGAVLDQLGGPGAGKRTAEAILRELEGAPG